MDSESNDQGYEGRSVKNQVAAANEGNNTNTATAGNLQPGEDGGPRIQSAVWRWRLKMVAYKSIVHAIISVAGVVAFIITGHVVSRTLGFQTILSMHFLFNWRLEDVLCPPGTGRHAKSRQSRELSAILQIREDTIVKRVESILRV